MVSESTENLFAAIYRLTRRRPYAKTKDIAESLGVSLPTVSEKIVKLAEQGYLDHKWRKGVALTQKGLLMSLNVLRKHRLIETFLVEMLDFSIEEVNDEACRLEHAVSERLTDAIDTALGYPDTDPHGHPIPSKSGCVKSDDYHSLADTLQGSEVEIKQVNDRDKDQLKYLRQVGIVPGARITVTDVAPFDGPLTLNMNEKCLVISRKMAQKIGVKKSENSNIPITAEST